MTEPTSAAPTSVAAPRPTVLDLPAEAAAKLVAPDKPCPVCGSWLEKTTASGATAGLPGVPQPAARCSTCGFQSGALVSWSALLGRAALFIFVGGLVAKLGMTFLHTKPIWGLLLLLAAPLGPILAFFDARRPGKRLAQLIHRGRARWTREKEEHDFKVDPKALLDASKPDADCPVCGRAKLEGPGPNPLWSRGNLRCPRCRLDVPMAFTELGFIAAIIAAGILVVVGAVVAREGFVNFVGNASMYRILIGFAIGAAGIYIGFIISASGDEIALKELERSKRRQERRKRGLPVKEDDDEPAVWFQENLEAVVVAVILALIIRHFVMEAFVIPTGSMAPTLLGDHFNATCKNCGYHFSVAKREGDIGRDGERVEFRCPLCGAESPDNVQTFYYPDVQGGNKILVNKFLYKLEPPERWNVIVFKYPNDPLRKNFIKRLVGLPGETLRIDGRGDVWVKKKGATDFALARKPRGVQEELWMPVYDSRYPDPRMPGMGKNGAWNMETDVTRWAVDRTPEGDIFTARTGTGEASLDYKKEIRDNYGYNPAGHGSQGRNIVGDVRVRVSVTPDKDCKAIHLSTVENTRVLTAEIPVGSGDVAVLASDTMENVITKAKCSPLRAGSPNELALGYADEHVTLIVNGETVLEWDDPQAPSRTETSGARIGCVGPGGARFEHVQLDRDLVYVESGMYDPSRKDLLVPDDCYFVMGDNSPNSQDGRVFGFVHEPHLIGRAFLVFWPLWEVKLIR